MQQITAQSSHNNIATVKWRKKRTEGGVGRGRKGRAGERKGRERMRGEERREVEMELPSVTYI